MSNVIKEAEFIIQKNKDKIFDVMPSYISKERFLRIAFSEIKRNPLLVKADPYSVAGCIFEAARLGLEIGGITGEASIVPFYDSKKEKYVAQLITQYRGKLKLLRNSPEVQQVEIEAVYKPDKFIYEKGLNTRLIHIPNIDENNYDDPDWVYENLKGVYVIVKFKNGTIFVKFVPKGMIEKRRKKSMTQKKSLDKPTGIWWEWYEEMAMKTAVHVVAKYLPLTTLAEVFIRDAAIEEGYAKVDFGSTIKEGIPPVVEFQQEQNIAEEAVVDAEEPKEKIQAIEDETQSRKVVINKKKPANPERKLANDSRQNHKGEKVVHIDEQAEKKNQSHTRSKQEDKKMSAPKTQNLISDFEDDDINLEAIE